MWPQRSFKVTNNCLIEETNAAEHYERTKFDIYKDDTCLVLTLTYVLMDNFLSLFNIEPRIKQFKDYVKRRIIIRFGKVKSLLMLKPKC